MTPWAHARQLCVVAAITVLPLVGLQIAAWAQEPPEVQITGVDTVDLPAMTLEVTIPAVLTGGPVDHAAITLFENGLPVPAQVTTVATDQLEVVLLIDTSGSMFENGGIEAAKAAAIGFLAELPANVPVGVVAFADTPVLVSPLTTDRSLLTAAISGLTATGETALYDGIVFGSSLFSSGTTDRQFVLLSDGGDTVSSATLDDAVAASAGIRTSGIELISSESNQQALVEIVESGSGNLTSISDPSGLSVLYQDVASSLVDRYQLAFTTAASGPTEFRVDVLVPDAVLSASTTVDLEQAPATTVAAPPTTVAEPATTVAQPATTVAADPDPVLPSEGQEPGGTGATGTDDQRLLLAAGAVAVFLAIVGFLFAVWPEAKERRLGRRQLGVAANTVRRSPGKSLSDRLTTLADDALDRRDQRGRLADTLDVSAVSMRPGEFVVFMVAVTITTVVVLFTLAGPLAALFGLLLPALIARMVLATRAARRRKAFEDQLPDVLQLVTSALRSGYSLPQALDALTRQTAEPARTEFTRVMFESRVGRELSESLAGVARRMQSTGFEWVVAAIDINREVGGELAQVLSTVAETIRERQQLNRQIDTLTAEGRISAYVLTALPAVMIVALSLINPGYFEPMTTAPGPAIIVMSLLLLLIGWIWMRRLIRTEM
jgi:tight adherence protein B